MNSSSLRITVLAFCAGVWTPAALAQQHPGTPVRLQAAKLVIAQPSLRKPGAKAPTAADGRTAPSKARRKN